MKRMRAVLPVAFAVIATWSVASVSAQSAPWRLVQGTDGVLFVIRGELKNRIVPSPMTDADMAITEVQPWEDGLMVVAPPDRTAAGAPSNPPPPSSSRAPNRNERIGDLTVLEASSGLRLVLVVNAVEDNVKPGKYDSAPKGRYMAVDWTIKNEGSVEARVNRLHFKLQTAEGFIIQRTSEVREPGLSTDVIDPGQTARGWLTYDVPAGARVVYVIYQPPGEPQFIIANL